ncbi:glycosyltransferase family 39 protein [Dyadobacter sp. 3J3]|uniref:glycosyltransferase family 39 protein n=1 Tax=Dyadobacter sp. 3J3 TaxID=2606600 RepID=UPI0013593275|nr:glycosyltransferase family 39 protein [Dyadobacter sp. 3J3]
MNFCLLLLSVLLSFVLFFLTSVKCGLYSKIRISFIYSLVANATAVFIYNEVFSYFDALNSTSAFVFWLGDIVLLLALASYWKSVGKVDFSNLSDIIDVVRLKGISRSNKIILIAAFLFFILPLSFLAVYSPPNNFDAHSYHLNRILYWINNGNLDHFPTVHIQQLYLNVFAEYIVLDTVLLSGSDYFAGLVQFCSFLGSLAAISLLAKRFGLKQEGQLLAVIILLTLPIGIFESTSAQVDYVACFFFITFVYFGFELLERKSWLTLLVMLLSLSFGGFTKYTVFIFALPFTVYFALRILLQYGFLYGVKVLILALVLLVLTFTPFFYRNYQLFGSVMSPPEDSTFFAEKIPVDKHSVLFALSGIIKNVGLHLGLPNTSFNAFLSSKINNFHQAIGVEIDDLALRLDPFSVRYSVHEDMVPNTIHIWLMLLATIPLLFFKGTRNIKWFWLFSVLGFVLFCSLLKFQLWSTRTHMPFFAMGAVLIAYVYSKVLNWNTGYLIFPLMLVSTLFVFGNPNKALLPVGYFSKKILGHIPVAFCVTDSLQSKKYEKDLGAYYDFPGKDNCHPLKQLPGYKERVKIFNILEKEGYYDDDKSATVFGTTRTKAYFLSHLDDYYAFEPLLEHITGDNKNIGVMFKKDGFYNYWAAVDIKLKNPGQMRYIRYLKDFTALKNGQNDFCYDYILCDDASLLKKFVPENNIAEIHNTSVFYLVKLKNRSCERLLY